MSWARRKLEGDGNLWGLLGCLLLAACSSETTTLPQPALTGTPTSGNGEALCGSSAGQIFSATAPWNQSVDTLSLDTESAAIIAYLQANHTAQARFRIVMPGSGEPYGFNVLYVDSNTTPVAWTPKPDEHWLPDCDTAPVPLPQGGALEDELGYTCTTNGDCHLIVYDKDTCRLYEMWRANMTSGGLEGGCLAVWNTDQVYPDTGRGDFCTSADAAGLPIAPVTFDADEIYRGEIKHALRFVLPNDLIRHYIYVRPATHSTKATAGGSGAPPYGVRVRLKASTPISGLSAGAQVIAQALKKYGMILADGGNYTFTAKSDTFTTHTWAEVDLAPNDLTALSWSDFEVVELGARIDYTSGECTRTVIGQ